MLTTERLLIRPILENDADDIFDYLSRQEVYQFEYGKPVDRKTAAGIARNWSEGTQFSGIVLRHEPGKLVGHISFMPSGPAFLKTYELGYMIHPDFQSMGYATEAAGAIVSHAFTSMGTHRIVAHCSDENPASWKVLEKCGFRQEGLEKQNIYFYEVSPGNPRWLDSYCYAILEHEYFKNNGGAG